MDLLDTQIYKAIGEEGFTRLVAAFYRQIPADDILGPMYASHSQDMVAAELRLREFLIQRFGGPQRYSEQRGHPRLRMRHNPFKVDVAARNRWMTLMDKALVETALPEPFPAMLRKFFADTATFMINQPF